MAGQHWSLVFVDFAIPVALDDELGRGVAEFESLRSLINGEFLLKDQLNELKPLLNGPKCTLSEMQVWLFFNSFSLLYYSSQIFLGIRILLQNARSCFPYLAMPSRAEVRGALLPLALGPDSNCKGEMYKSADYFLEGRKYYPFQYFSFFPEKVLNNTGIIHQISNSSFASQQISPSCSAEKSIIMLFPSILSLDSCCHSSPMALPQPALYSFIFLMRAQSSLLALKTNPLLISCVVMIFSQLQSSLLVLLKISSRASSVFQNYFSIAFVFSGLSCSYLQSLVRQEQTLMSISGARSMFLLISQGLLKISERTVYLSCLMVLISLNSYSIVVELRRFLRMLTYNLSSLPPLMGYSNFFKRASVSICRWQLFLRMFCSKMGRISLTSVAVRSSVSVIKVFVLLVLTLTMLWVMFLMMFWRHCLKSNFLPTFATKNPMPLVQFEAIFSLSLSLCFIMQSRHYFNWCSFSALAKMLALAQFDKPQVILTMEFKDLYCLESQRSVLMDLEVMLSVWNSGQKEMQPRSLMSATLIKELFLIGLMEGQSVEVSWSSTKEEKQCMRNDLALTKLGSLQQSQSMQVRVDSSRRQLLTVTSRQQVYMNLRRNMARVSCFMLDSHLILADWLLMNCSQSKYPLKIYSTNSLQQQLMVDRKLAQRAVHIDSSPCILKKMMLKYFFDSLVKQLMISLTNLSSSKFLLPLFLISMTSISL